MKEMILKMRGVNKLVIEVKNPESEYFERAILFLKPESKLTPQSDISQSADRLLEAVVKNRKEAVSLPLPSVILIAAVSAALAAAVVLMFF